MFRVELDIFSGRPNPRWMLSWDEGQQLLDRIANGGARVIPYDPYDPKFGIYQGFLLQKAFVPIQDMGMNNTLRSLPDVFRVIGDKSLTSEEEAWLLKTAGALFTSDANLSNALWSTVELSKQYNQSSSMTQRTAGTTELQGCSWAFTGDDFGFWNDSDYDRWNNNCYNFAAGIKTWTFAQPGRAAGQEAQYPGLTCFGATHGVKDAAFRDGVRDYCDGDNFRVGLAVRSDGQDYHWWRQVTSDPRWGHKPGDTAARVFDWAGEIIFNPETSHRGPYDVWCGYYYIPLWITIE